MTARRFPAIVADTHAVTRAKKIGPRGWVEVPVREREDRGGGEDRYRVAPPHQQDQRRSAEQEVAEHADSEVLV
jgi:hypothetical protein